jgi:hypothetical protein
MDDENDMLGEFDDMLMMFEEMCDLLVVCGAL